MSENSQLHYLWKQISERVKNTISPISYDHLFKYLEPIDLVGRKLVLKASSEGNAEAIMNKFQENIRDAMLKCDLGVNDFRLVVDGSELFSENFE
jgi:chromosomal replication initiation ATPase DnaA